MPAWNRKWKGSVKADERREQMEMTLLDNLSNEEIFDKEAFIGFIEVLDNYKDYLLYEE